MNKFRVILLLKHLVEIDIERSNPIGHHWNINMSAASVRLPILEFRFWPEQSRSNKKRTGNNEQVTSILWLCIMCDNFRECSFIANFLCCYLSSPTVWKLVHSDTHVNIVNKSVDVPHNYVYSQTTWPVNNSACGHLGPYSDNSAHIRQLDPYM